MKLMMSSVLAATLATSAFASSSDRYNDNRFDTAAGHVTQSATSVPAPTTVVFSSNSGGGNGASGSYPYSNPFGVGPYNDSR